MFEKNVMGAHHRCFQIEVANIAFVCRLQSYGHLFLDVGEAILKNIILKADMGRHKLISQSGLGKES